jgi:hypothetical protein
MRPWSHSRLSTYEDCPKQYWYSYVENLPGFRPESPAAMRGSGIHDRAEQYLLGKISMYPPELQKVSSHAMSLKRFKAQPEVHLGVTEKWEPCDYRDPKAYLRGIIDILFEDTDGVHVEDWKTGQVYNSHAGQMETYTAIVAAHYPTAPSYITRLVYIDQGLVTAPKRIEQDRVKPIRLLLDGRIGNAEEDTIFPVKPGAICKWCDYSKRYGGPCVY